MMCDGLSLDDVLALDAARLEEHGFIVQAVGGGSPRPARGEWAYTIGLLDRVGHPELIVAGPQWELAGELVHEAAHWVLDDGVQLRPGDVIGSPPNQFRIGAVHRAQYDLDTFAMWHNLKSYGAIHAPQLEAVQLLMPRSLLSERHQHAQPNLAVPSARVGLQLPHVNRARRGGRRRRGRA